MRRAGAGALVVVAALALVGCSSSQSTHEAKRMPASSDMVAHPAALDSARMRIVIEAVSASGEDLYDMAKAASWTRATAGLDSLRAASNELRGALRGDDIHLKRLAKVDTLLAGGIASRNRGISMRAANAVTWIGADLAAEFSPAVRVEIARLDFYGRELEIGSSTADMDMLHRAADGARRDWQSLRPAIVALGGAEEAKAFDRIMTRLEAAMTPVDFGRLATPMLDEVDNLERVAAKH